MKTQINHFNYNPDCTCLDCASLTWSIEFTPYATKTMELAKVVLKKEKVECFNLQAEEDKNGWTKVTFYCKPTEG